MPKTAGISSKVPAVRFLGSVSALGVIFEMEEVSKITAYFIARWLTAITPSIVNRWLWAKVNPFVRLVDFWGCLL